MSSNETLTSGAATLGPIRLPQLALAVASLAFGVAIGYLIATTHSGIDVATEVVDGSVVTEEFIRLNTTDLESLTPSATEPLAVTPRPAAADVRGFLNWNTTALDAIVGTQATPSNVTNSPTSHFLHWNVGALELAPKVFSEKPGSPR